MPFVNISECRPAKYGEDIWTQGLDTCIGIVAYGLPSVQGGVNKVMAHASTGEVPTKICDEFIAMVRGSGMSIRGICMSCPSPDRYNHVSDADLRQMIADMRRINLNQVTQADVQRWRHNLNQMLRTANDQATQACIQNLRVTPSVCTRDNRHLQDPSPYGTLVASKSPGGQVSAEGHRMASIPNAASGASASASRGDASKRASAPSGSSRPPSSSSGGGSSSSGRHHHTAPSSSSKKLPVASSSSKKLPSNGSSTSKHKSSRLGRP